MYNGIEECETLLTQKLVFVRLMGSGVVRVLEDVGIFKRLTKITPSTSSTWKSLGRY